MVPALLALLVLAAQQTVADGVLVDRDYAFRLAAPDPEWRILDTASVVAVDPDAVAGALNRFQGGTVAAEPFPSGRIDAYFERVLNDIDLPDLEILASGPVRYHGLDARRVEHVGAPSGVKVRYRTTCYVKDGFGFRVAAWLPVSMYTEKRMVAFELAVTPTEDVVRGRGAAPDAPEQVGPGFALRGGVYRDFERGVAWTAPPGLREIRAGDDARAVDPRATLLLEVAQGVEGWLALEPASGDGAEYHERARAGALAGEPAVEATAPEPVVLGGATALASALDVARDGAPVRYHVLTAVHDGTGAALVLSGAPDDVKAAAPAIAAAQRALRFERVAPTAERDGRFEDRRLGFAFTPPPGEWIRRDAAGDELRACGAMQEWTEAGGTAMVAVVALCPREPDRDEAWFRAFLGERFAAGTAGTPVGAGATVAGRAARRLRWTDGDGGMDACVLRRDRTFYAVLVTSREGSDPAEVAAGLALLDL